MSLFSCNLSLIQTPFQLNNRICLTHCSYTPQWTLFQKGRVETVKSPHIYTVQKMKNLNSNLQTLTYTEKPLVLQFSLKLNHKRGEAKYPPTPYTGKYKSEEKCQKELDLRIESDKKERVVQGEKW